MKIYIVGPANDPHSEHLARALGQLKVNIEHLDFYNLPLICVQISNWNKQLVGLPTNNDFIFWRFKQRYDSPDFAERHSIEDIIHWKEQWMLIMRTVSLRIDRARQYNTFVSVFRAQHKPYQLLIASDIGFRVPNTIISNDITEIADFLCCHSETIFKSMSTFLPKDGRLFTSKITASELHKDAECVSKAPSLFQERIAKDYEVRAYVGASFCHAIRIDATQNKDAEIDWRVATHDMGMYSECELDDQTVAMARKYLDVMGLDYGAFDFIISPQGETVFLECNPGGQWLFAEEATAVKITESIANDIFAKYAGR